MQYVNIDSGFGTLIAAISNDGVLNGLWFENQKYFPKIVKDALWSEDDHVLPEPAMITLRNLKKQIAEYQEGVRKTFEIEINPSGTEFQKIIWRQLMEIPYGETTTYGELAHKAAQVMGRETMSAQAVGGAVGHNPISIIIPCHRVIGKKGDLTGYAGGLDKKKTLLDVEAKG